MNKHRWWICILVLLSPQSMEECRGVGPYRVTNLGALPGGGDISRAYDVNSLGQVVGVSGDIAQRAFLWTPVSPNSTNGSMIDLGDLPGGGSHSNAFGINSLGQVAGTSGAQTGSRAFLWTPVIPNGTTGTMIDLGDLPGGRDESVGEDINDYGQVVGYSSHGFSLSDTHAFLWTPTAPNGTSGSMTGLGDLPGGFNSSLANDISPQGKVAGASSSNSGTGAFIWNPSATNGTTGTLIDIGAPYTFNSSNAVNSHGQIAGGGSHSSGSVFGFVWTPDVPNGLSGSYSPLGDLPGADLFNQEYTWSEDINTFGHVVGLSNIGDLIYHAFIWVPTTANGTSGQILDLNSLLEPMSGAGWDLQQASGINDLGQIVGYGSYDPDGEGDLPAVTRGFLLTPVPEPSTFLLSIIALLCSQLTGRYRKDPI